MIIKLEKIYLFSNHPNSLLRLLKYLYRGPHCDRVLVAKARSTLHIFVHIWLIESIKLSSNSYFDWGEGTPTFLLWVLCIILVWFVSSHRLFSGFIRYYYSRRNLLRDYGILIYSMILLLIFFCKYNFWIFSLIIIIWLYTCMMFVWLYS